MQIAAYNHNHTISRSSETQRASARTLCSRCRVGSMPPPRFLCVDPSQALGSLLRSLRLPASPRRETLPCSCCRIWHVALEVKSVEPEPSAARKSKHSLKLTEISSHSARGRCKAQFRNRMPDSYNLMHAWIKAKARYRSRFMGFSVVLLLDPRRSRAHRQQLEPGLSYGSWRADQS